jgi:hypothetical protein
MAGDILKSIEGAYELGFYEIKDIVKKTININPLDPLFLTLSNSDGSTTEYYVSKKEDGSVDKVESINVISKENNLEFRIKIISDSKVELSTLTLEGDLITKQIIDIKDLETSDLQAIKRSKKSKQVYDPEIIHKTTRALSNSNTKSANIEVTVNECGSPTDDANVFIILSGIDMQERKLPARNNGNGNYLFEIPYSSDSDAIDNAKDICKQGMDVINTVCRGDIISTLAQSPISVCAYFTAIAAGTIVGAPYAPVLYKICLGSLVAGGLVCNTLGKSAVEGSPSIGDAFCQDGIDYIDWSLDSKYDHAIISVSLPGQEMKVDPIKIVYGEKGSYSFDFDSPEPISKFTASPLKGSAPLVVSLDATGSTPTKEECVDYIWSSSASHNSNGKTTVMQFENSGEYTINLEVKSKYGDKSSISTATVVVEPKPPKISITYPYNGQSIVSISGMINISMSIITYSEKLQIEGVEFTLDGTIIGQDKEVPYTASFDGNKLKSGSHTLTAYAWVPNYSGGGVSDTVTFKVGETDCPTNSLGMNFVKIENGSETYCMQTTEVTQGQWTAVMGSNPSRFTGCGENCPVEQVSWDDAQVFIAALNAKGEGTYSLPTEAQWEYAARAGSTTDFANGDMTGDGWGCTTPQPNLDAMGWYCGNSGNTTHPVAQKSPNDWGLYDMHGNVWEWCQDLYSSGSSDRVTRGGGWNYYAYYCRSANRYYPFPSSRNDLLGFRLVRLAGQQ